MTKTLIKNAHVVLPTGVSKTSVLIADGRIADIDPAIQLGVDQVVDATGKYLIPGVIDDQVHFREPGLTHKEDLAHASRACAKGGVTSYLEMPNTNPTTTTQEALLAKLQLAAKSSIVNYGFYMGATPTNVAELKRAVRTPGIKIFIGSSTGDLLVDDQEALERIFAETTLPICAHCEDEGTVRRNGEKYKNSTDVADHSKVRDEEAAYVATKRALDLAFRHKHKFHVLHVSTARELELLRDHRNLITAEVCPHHLFFSVDDYRRLGSLIKMNPSIKSKRDTELLWNALLDGDIQIVATDHAPHTLEEKALPYPKCPSGLPAVENYLALMLNQVNKGKCTIEQVVAWLSTGPAKIWNMVGKGRIEVGFDADLALVDMNLRRVIRNSEQETKCKWSPWDGVELQGWAVQTWVCGEEVYRFSEGKSVFADLAVGREIQYDRALGGYWGSH